MYRIGDQVCYPMHGVGTVEAIEEQSVLGQQKEYYVLRFVIGRMTALVPVEGAGSVGLRPVSGREECDRVLTYLESGNVEEETVNWNKRYRDNMDKLKEGSLMNVAEVVKSLLARDKRKGLSTGERKMLITARQVLLTELTVASGLPCETLEALVTG
ncbi:MAG: CarD family transcriptional regulator [Clostridia bacterium]|nr:CarD family transcriptional regulator [Clostridia bacterium]